MEIKEKLLTVIVPTCNRADMLDKNLQRLSELSSEYLFDIIICNNASTDNTIEVITKWKSTIKNVTVINQKINMYFDRNVASGYFHVSTEYCWVLGDSYCIDGINMRKMLNLLETHKPQALIVDAFRQIGGDNYWYNDRRSIFLNLGWYVSLLCSMIIKKDFITNERCGRYYDSNFVHTGVFFDYLATSQNVNVLYTSSVNLEHVIGNKANTSWRRTPFEVYGMSWYSFIMSLPIAYSVKDKLYCIKQHDIEQNLFSPKQLLKLKLSGYYDFKDYKRNRWILNNVCSHPLWIYDILNVIPSMPSFYKWLKRASRFF